MGGDFPTENIVDFWDIVFMGEESLGCLQEINKCLKIEASLGNISQEEYENFVELVVGAIEMLYPERLEEFKEANLYNRSMEGFELKLIPYYEI